MSPHSLPELLAAWKRGPVDLLLFYGHTPPKDGGLSKAVFSQFWPCDFTVDGHRYRWAEQWMMAEKARTFGDDEILARVLVASSPAACKKLGRQVRGFTDERWRAVRFEVVVRGNREKFGQDPALRDFLLGTGEAVLVEAAPGDRIWGIGYGANQPEARDPTRWRGLNLLGFALTRVRDELRG